MSPQPLRDGDLELFNPGTSLFTSEAAVDGQTDTLLLSGVCLTCRHTGSQCPATDSEEGITLNDKYNEADMSQVFLPALFNCSHLSLFPASTCKETR